jgi:hypothetical protein
VSQQDNKCNGVVLLAGGRALCGSSRRSTGGRGGASSRAIRNDHLRCRRFAAASMNIYLIAGVWDCGGALVVFLRFASSSKDGKNDKLLLHCSETNQLEVLNLPRSITPERSDHCFCSCHRGASSASSATMKRSAETGTRT